MRTAAIIVGQILTLAIVGGLLFGALGNIAVIPVVLLGAIYFWGLFSYAHYRLLRQEELLHLLSTAAEAESPVGPAVWAYLSDRPRRWGYEHKVERLAVLLESGESLAGALRATPGLVPSETVLAAAVGEPAGQLALCLRNAPRWRLATVWMEAVPRFVYPLVLLAFSGLCFVGFILIIMPKFEKIYHDFHIHLPESTSYVMAFARSPVGGILGLGLACVVFALLAAVLIASPTARWYFPGIGRLTRMHVQSRVLAMLGILLETNRPLPEALDLLADSGYFAGTAHRRLVRARQRIAQGEALAPCLRELGLLPGRMVPLVQTAERTRNVPRVLTELGSHLAQCTVRAVRRVSMMFFPLAVLGVGALIGFLAVAWFMPLVKLLTEIH
jgi:type IV pilus assembly protein PilC